MSGQSPSNQIDRIAVRYIVPAAVILDLYQSLVKFIEAGMRVVEPGIYNAWVNPTNPFVAFAHAIAENLVIAALSVAAAAMLYRVMPLQALMAERLAKARVIKNKRMRNEMVITYTERKKQVRGLVFESLTVPLLFFSLFYLPDTGLTTLIDIIGSIISPIITLHVLVTAERLHMVRDAGEVMHERAQQQVIDAAENINLLNNPKPEHVGMMREGLNWNIGGMVDQLIPGEKIEGDVWMTIRQICEWIGCNPEPKTADRQRVYNRIKFVVKKEMPGAVRTQKGNIEMASAALVRYFTEMQQEFAARRLETNGNSENVFAPVLA